MARAVQQLCEKVELVIKTNEESRSHFDQLLQIHAEGRRQMEQLIQAHAESQEHTKKTQEQILASQGKLLEEMHNASDKRGQEQEESAIRELREKLMERLPRSQASPVQQPAGAATQQSAANPTNFVAGESSAPRAPAREPYRAPHLRNENTHRGDAHFRDNNGRQNGLGGQTNARQAHFEEDLEHEGSPAGAARVQTNLFPNSPESDSKQLRGSDSWDTTTRRDSESTASGRSGACPTSESGTSSPCSCNRRICSKRSKGSKNSGVQNTVPQLHRSLISFSQRV